MLEKLTRSIKSDLTFSSEAASGLALCLLQQILQRLGNGKIEGSDEYIGFATKGSVTVLDF